MKKILNIGLLLVAVLSFTSCKKALDVEPQQSIDAGTALQNDQDVNSLVVGGYALMGGGALYGTNLQMMPDLLGADGVATWRGTFQSPRQVATKTMNSFNEDANRIWTTAYRVIDIANTTVDALGVVKDANLKKQLEGEALFMRGVMHFELVRLYALPWGATPDNSQLGVIVKLKPTKTEADAFARFPRNTVNEVYTQVLADLTKAVTLLPATSRLRVTRFTALGFLSRVYLAQGNYAAARDAANTVIASGNYVLNASVLAVFNNKNTRESIFEIQQNEQNNAGTGNDGMATFYASLPGIGRADVRVVASYVANNYPAGDLRRTEWYYIGTGARPGNTYSGKWTSFSQNIPIIRLAEMFLTRAESNLVLSTVVGATPDADYARVKNSIRTNSIAAPATLVNIRSERFIELAFEGHRIHDLRRLRLNTGSLPWNSNRLVFPIPQREIDAAQGVLVQNPGY